MAVPYLTAIWITVSPFNYDFVASQEYKSQPSPKKE